MAHYIRNVRSMHEVCPRFLKFLFLIFEIIDKKVYSLVKTYPRMFLFHLIEKNGG